MMWYELIWYMWTNYLAAKIFNPLRFLLRQLGQPCSDFCVGNLDFWQLYNCRLGKLRWKQSKIVTAQDKWQCIWEATSVFQFRYPWTDQGLAWSSPQVTRLICAKGNLSITVFRLYTRSLRRTIRACSLTRRVPASSVRLVKTKPRPLPSMSSTLHPCRGWWRCHSILLW